MSSSLFDKTTSALGASINFRNLRHNVVSSNVANAETPGYKAKKVDFEAALANAIDAESSIQMHTEHSDHFPIGKGSLASATADVYDNPDINLANDKNTVDMEKEMAKLAENTILYKAALRLVNKKLASIRYAATEGSR